MTEDAEQVQRTLAVATDVVDKLMMACGEGNAQAGAYVVRQVFDAQNPDLLMLVLGRLVTRLTAAERRLERPDGPLVTSNEMGDVDPVVPWSMHVQEQMEAAAEQQDYPTLARIMFDAQVRAARQDAADGMEMDQQYLFSALMRLDRATLMLCAAEGLLRQLNG